MPPGSPNLFKPELGRNLNRLFQPQVGGFEVPQILSGVVNLTNDFPGTLPYLSLSTFDNTGGVDVTLISSAISPPDGFIWLIDELSVLANNEPASRELRLYLTLPGGAVVTVGRWTTGTVLGFPFPLGRRIVMVPNSVLSLTINALTAGGNLRYTFSYFQLPAGQFVPKN